MPSPSSARSVKISDDERGGWSSDRPRRDGAPPRPADISTRCRVLAPSDRMRYTPGSLLLIASAAPADRDVFAQRVLEEKNALLSMDKVRRLLAGKVEAEEVEERAQQLLDAAVGKRLAAGESVVVALDGLDAEERARYVRPAAGLRRPRHLLLLETDRAKVAEEDLLPLNELRTALNSGALGAEGIQTVLRLGGAAIGELNRIVFRPPPKDD